MNQKATANDPSATRIVVIEGSPLGTAVAKSFLSADEAQAFVIERVRANVNASLRDRFERAVIDRIVSEDGVKATSAVLEGTLAYLRALAKAYAPTRISITTPVTQQDEEDERN